MIPVEIVADVPPRSPSTRPSPLHHAALVEVKEKVADSPTLIVEGENWSRVTVIRLEGRTHDNPFQTRDGS
jgi:hypothetical protein